MHHRPASVDVPEHMGIGAARSGNRLYEHMFYTTEMSMAVRETNPLETLIGAIERFVQLPTLELTPTELGSI